MSLDSGVQRNRNPYQQLKVSAIAAGVLCPCGLVACLSACCSHEWTQLASSRQVASLHTEQPPCGACLTACCSHERMHAGGLCPSLHRQQVACALLH